jgi:DNA-binding transcriptional LysR family regulator
LERELDTRLFDRTTHRVVLTDTGQALLGEAQRTLAAAEAARDAVAAVQGGVRGTVRLGIMHSLALIDLGSLLTNYHQERPLVQLIPSFAPGGSVELARDVINGQLDLAFAALPGGYPPQLSVHTLASEEMVLACPPGHPLAKRRPIALADLNGERFVDFPPGWGTRLAVDQLFASAGLHREIAVEVADIPNVVDLVRAGFGFAFIGPSTVPDTRRLVVRKVSPSAQFTVSMIISTERPQSAATRALADLIVHTYPVARSTA